MTNKQFKHRFLRSEIHRLLTAASAMIQRGADQSSIDYNLRLALAYARQLPDNSKWKAQRAWIVTAVEACHG